MASCRLGDEFDGEFDEEGENDDDFDRDEDDEDEEDDEDGDQDDEDEPETWQVATGELDSSKRRLPLDFRR
jgi:hypothetical protein